MRRAVATPGHAGEERDQRAVAEHSVRAAAAHDAAFVRQSDHGVRRAAAGLHRNLGALLAVRLVACAGRQLDPARGPEVFAEAVARLEHDVADSVKVPMFELAGRAVDVLMRATEVRDDGAESV